MENVILVIHLLLALGLIGIVLLQRSEGGGLGMGGGGGGGVMSARGTATALGKITWGLAIAFLVTSMVLTVLSAKSSADRSVVDGMIVEETAPAPIPDSLNIEGMLPPVTPDEPLTPPRAD
jgi:preprotein translocase subunit SecG